MKIPDFEETVGLSRFFTEHFYQRDLDSILPMLHPNIMWIGAAEGQYTQGLGPVTDRLLLISDAPACKIQGQSYRLIHHDLHTGVVTGRFLARTTPKSGEIFAAVQRVTFVWRQEPSGFRIIHLHTSNPLELQKPGEHFPHKIGRATYQYVKKLLKSQPNYIQPLVFNGKNAETYFLRPDEIAYVEAANTACCIHCSKKQVVVGYTMNQMSEQLPSYFVRIHRSYTVNPDYISEIVRCHVILKDGSRLPVPEKKYTQVKEQIRAYFAAKR